MIFQAPTLEEAYKKASDYFNCSVSEFEDIKLIQAPSNMLFGFIKKDAIVEINFQKKTPVIEEKAVEEKVEEQKIEEKVPVVEEVQEENLIENDADESLEVEKVEEVKEVKEEVIEETHKKDVVREIEEKINDLFSKSCFKLSKISVKKLDDETIYINFDGEDAALLIGTEGYRYNALSYMLFNWINQKYGFKIKLEVAEFLKNQEEMINKLLVPIIDTIEKEGRINTKPFDGILLHIAVEKLRSRFPDKYVGVKVNKDGKKYIVVNKFLRKNV